MRELWRRLLFLFCVCGAVLLFLAASLAPVVLVAPVIAMLGLAVLDVVDFLRVTLRLERTAAQPESPGSQN